MFFKALLILQRGDAGNQRSLIRLIASRLPLKPLPRVHFTIVNPDYAASYDWDTHSTLDEGLAAIPTLDNQGKIEFWRLLFYGVLLLEKPDLIFYCLQ